jgi:hypothetical protein
MGRLQLVGLAFLASTMAACGGGTGDGGLDVAAVGIPRAPQVPPRDYASLDDLA